MDKSKGGDQVLMCQTTGCGKPSTLKCPTCVKLDLAPSFFCSQECFKNFWAIHKLIHVKKDKEESDPKKASKKDKYNYTGPLRPGKVFPKLPVPEDIKKPDYAFSGIPNEEIQNRANKVIEVHTKEDIEILREAGVLGRKVLDYAHSLVKEGVTTDEIDRKTHQFIIDNKSYPSPLNYHGFPKSICTSINEVICHGIPDDRPLEDGDIINIDVSIYYKGFHTDLNETYCVGKVAESSKFLIEKTYTALEKAIAICKPGTMYRDVGNVIGRYIEENSLSVVRSYSGHGVGRIFHCAPNVPHYNNNKATGFMREGHVFTIEPMINQGTWKDVLWTDDWTAVTADGQRSAQFEHTLLITDSGCEVLTKRLPESPELHWKV